MTYRELLKLYRDGKVEEDKRQEIEADIEKQDAISEYLYEQSEIPGIDDLSAFDSDDHGADEENTAEAYDSSIEFTKMIHSSIRKAFVKLGVTVACITIVVVLVIIFVLPKAVDHFYYDPTEAVDSNGDMTTDRLSLDITTYSELFLPGKYQFNAQAYGYGYGKYDIVIHQCTSYSGRVWNVSGKIVRNKMTLYDTSALSQVPWNAFDGNAAGVEDHCGGSLAGGVYQYMLESLKKLDEHDFQYAYVTMDHVYTYSEFLDWCKENEVAPNWCALCNTIPYREVGNEHEFWSNGPVGFVLNTGCCEMFFDQDKYPYLTTFSTIKASYKGNDDWIVSEDVMTQHVVSMLNYMRDESEFYTMFSRNDEVRLLEKLAQDIQENGLHIYGFEITAQKAEILDLIKNEKVAYIYTTPEE